MPNLLDKVLEEYGLKYEDLNASERETYNSKVFEVKNLSITDLKEKIIDMKNSIALQLCDVLVDANDVDSIKKDFHLKARLKNYLMLEAFLTSPEKAEKALRDSLNNLKKGQ